MNWTPEVWKIISNGKAWGTGALVNCCTGLFTIGSGSVCRSHWGAAESLSKGRDHLSSGAACLVLLLLQQQCRTVLSWDKPCSGLLAPCCSVGREGREWREEIEEKSERMIYGESRGASRTHCVKDLHCMLDSRSVTYWWKNTLRAGSFLQSSIW